MSIPDPTKIKNDPRFTCGDPSPKIYFMIDHASRNFTFYGKTGEVVGTMDFGRVPAFEGSLDESARLFFEGVANLWNNEVTELRAKLQAAEERIAALVELADDYASHDSWRCGYYDECHCGLNELQRQAGLELSPCGYDKQEWKP